MKNELTQLLGIQHPIILAPMGSTAGGLLAQAVSEAGGLGLIGAGYSDQDWLAGQLDLVTPGSCGVGFICWHLQQNPELLDFALSKKPRAIGLGFGDIKPFVKKIHDHNIPIICQVQTLAQAIECEKLGADVIVAQGSDAGGHCGQRGTFTLVPAVADHVSVPVVAAGGIGDHRGFNAALALGAQGVLVGSRFIATNEALKDPVIKQHLLSAKGDDVVQTRAFDYARDCQWPQTYIGRALRNSFTTRWQNDAEAKAMPQEAKAQYQQACKEANLDIAGIFVGECVDLIHEILPAKAVVEQIVGVE